MFFGNNQNHDWTKIRESLLESGLVQLWLANTTVFNLNNIFDLLSEEEINKSEKFYFSKDRKTYLVSRGLLRFLLGKYLNISGCDIRFDYNRYGKPELAFPHSEQIFFNVSHSGEFCLIGFSQSSQIGVDIEFMKPVEYDLLAKNVFSNTERSELKSISDDHKSKAFYSGWTRKESFIKGIGAGMSFPLKNFSIALNPETLVSKVEIHLDNSEAYKYWKVYDIAVETEYRAALAVKNFDETLFESFNADDLF